MDEWLFRWACVMSDVNDCLPTSRFAHVKKATLNATCDFFLFSLSPSNQCSSDDRLITYEYQSMQVRRSLAAFSDVSQYTLTCDKLIIRTEISLSELQREASIKFTPKEHRVNVESVKYGFVWVQENLKVVFYSGANFEIKSVHAQKFRALVSSTLKQKESSCFTINGMQVDFITQFKLNFQLGTIEAHFSSTRMALFSITLDQVFQSISRVLDLLRLMKQLKYGAVDRPPSPHTDLTVITDRVNLNISPYSTLDNDNNTISLTYASFKYISTASISEYALESGSMAFKLSNQVKQEVASFDKMIYRMNKDPLRLGVEFTLCQLKCAVVNRPMFGTMMTGLSSFANHFNIILINPRTSPPSPPPTFFKIKCDVIDLALCHLSDQNLITTMARVRVSELMGTFDCTAPMSQVIADIRRLDSPERVEYYQPSGGRLKLSMSSARFLSTVFGMEIVTFEKMNLSGLMYFASLQHKMIQEMTSYSRTPSDLDEDMDCDVPITTRSAPSKLYSDLLFATDKIRVTLSDVSDECIQESLTIASKAFHTEKATSNKASDDELTSWDALRYWCHGSLSFACGSIQLKYATTPTPESPSRPPIQLRFSLEQLKMIVSESSLELRTYNLLVNIRQKKLAGIEPLDMINIPGRFL